MARAANQATAAPGKGAPSTFANGIDVLNSRHIIYIRTERQWYRNEQRLRGGDAILTELVPFDWERQNLYSTTGRDNGQELVLQAAVERNIMLQSLNMATHYEQRQAQAVYLNFPDMYATVMAGHLLKAAPKPDAGLSFGQMGDVRADPTGLTPTQAELVFYNADGVGNQSSQWDNFWIGAMRRAMSTGHRWIMVEAPTNAPGTRDKEIAGQRPYMVEYSPLQVTNWHYEQGRLVFAIMRLRPELPYLDVTGIGDLDTKDDYMLLVAEGYDALGDAYSGGGWWRFTFDTELIGTGTWNATGGAIPLFPLYHERDHGSRGDPQFSRPGLTELGQCAVSYMNLASAADFDAWDAAMSIEWMLGVDVDAFNVAMAKLKEGSRFIPVPPHGDTEVAPTIKDSSAGVTVAEVFDKRLASKRIEAAQLAAREATSTPDSSGISKMAGFGQVMSPRLALMASELEAAQNTALLFLEQRFGHPGGQASVNWTRNFELLEVVAHIEAQFALERLSGLRSPTLDAQMMVTAAREKGLLGNDVESAVVATEYRASAAVKLQYGAQERALLDDVNNTD